MAANDYYNTTSYSSPATHNRTDAPLPPTPGNHSTTSISPVTSPFDDHTGYTYPSSQNLASHPAPIGYSNTSYHGAASPPLDSQSHFNRHYDSQPGHGGGGYQGDPFADQNAIPLREQHGKMDASPTRYQEGGVYERNFGGPHEKRGKKKKGWLSGRVTWVVYILTTVQIGVFVGELIKNGVLTGTPIQIKPQFNIMIGPSPFVLINMGARYPPCMHNIRGVTDSNDKVAWPCPDTTSDNFTIPENQCTLTQLCGFGGNNVPEQTYPTPFRTRTKEPNQWWRFIIPIFLHAGLIHIAFNMLLQLTLGRDMEKEIGSLRFALVYFSAGIFGFVLGGNYAAPNIPSVGASGSLFGILALVLLDLLYNWGSRRSPVKDLLFILLDMAIAFVLGLLPGLDNFSHIGGFLMGLVLGICLLHSPTPLRERIGVNEPPYSTVDTEPSNSGTPAIAAFVKKPVGFFKGRKPLWWAWWLVRAGALVGVFIGFILLLRNFYEWRNECKWCHHLTCLPIKNWCNIGNFNLTELDNSQKQNQSQNPARLARDLLLPVVLDAGLI